MHSSEGETILTWRNTALVCLYAVWLCVASAACTQAQQAPGPTASPTRGAAASASAKPALTRPAGERTLPAGESTKPAIPPPFPTDAAARPAAIKLRDGKLTIEANNSDLGQILQNLASVSGMTINGLNKGPRVFGVYGPGNSREVLSDLLVGSGYNFIMVGDGALGAPRELLLTPQNNNASATVPVDETPVADEEADETDQPQVEVTPTPEEPPGPGAIVPAPSPNSQEDDNVRVQQTLQRLQRMQEQEQPKPPQ